MAQCRQISIVHHAMNLQPPFSEQRSNKRCNQTTNIDAPLGGEVVLNLFETGMLAQEYPQLVLDGLGLLPHLPHRPAVYIPPKVNHAVLLKQVIVELILGDQLGVMGSLVVNLNGHLPPAVFNEKVGKPAVLVDVGEGILGVKITGFLGAEGVGKQFDEQILGAATGGGAIGGHKITSHSTRQTH